MSITFLRDGSDTVEIDCMSDGTIFITAWRGHTDSPSNDEMPVLLSVEQVRQLKKILKKQVKMAEGLE